jgi:hypothetical protein
MRLRYWAVEQVPVPLLARNHNTTVRKDDFCADEFVRRETAAADQRPVSAAQHQATQSHDADRTGRGADAELIGVAGEVNRTGTAADPCDLSFK